MTIQTRQRLVWLYHSQSHSKIYRQSILRLRHWIKEQWNDSLFMKLLMTFATLSSSRYTQLSIVLLSFSVLSSSPTPCSMISYVLPLSCQVNIRLRRYFPEALLSVWHVALTGALEGELSVSRPKGHATHFDLSMHSGKQIIVYLWLSEIG